MYKSRHLLGFISLSFALNAYAGTVISVTTTTDENGENLQNCSIREAVTAINTRTTFGGCPAGHPFLTNTIQLENKTYVLTRGELIPKKEMTFAGFDTSLAEEKDPITRLKPKRMPATTEILGNGTDRLFNTSVEKFTLHIKDLILANGHATTGAIILAGGQVNVINSLIKNSQASVQGGAIHLEGNNANLNSTDSIWQNNQSPVGAVISMSCAVGLNPTTHAVSFLRNLILENGNNQTFSVIDGCGNSTISIDTSTITQNTVATSATLDSGVIFAKNLQKQGKLELSYATIVENNGTSAITYGDLSDLIFQSSILAFNNGLSCVDGTQNADSPVLYVGAHNALQNCTLPAKASDPNAALGTAFDNQIIASNIILNSELNPLDYYGGVTKTYLPKASSIYILDKGLSAGACVGRTDQRASSSHGETNSSIKDACDIGAIERRVATASNEVSLIVNNRDDTNRLGEANLFINDIPSEDDTTSPPSATGLRGDFGKLANGDFNVTLTDNAQGRCSVVQPSTSKEERPYIQFDNKGFLLAGTQAVVCKYTFVDSYGQISTDGQVAFRVVNKAPIAEDDTFTLPSNATRVLIDLAKNDSDKNDGIYGKLCSSDTVKCNGGHYIRIVTNPMTGSIEGDKANCPDFDDANKYQCFKGDIYYRTNSTLSPFNDSFTYVVYDDDLTISNAATVTIINQAGQNEEQNSGSLGWGSLLVLAGFTVYRRRKYRFV